VLAAAAPEGVDEPSCAVVTDGPGGGAYYEHAAVAAALGVPLVAIFVGSEPGLTGPMGQGPIEVIGGKGQMPSIDDVSSALARVL